MAYLLDTGILLRLFDRSHPDCLTIRAAVRSLKLRQEVLCTSHQNIAEFWNVSTRPTSARGGLGLPVAQLAPRVAFIERLCMLVSSDHRAYLEWRRIVVQLNITGVSVHDARIAAVMMVHNVTNILTLNPQDFQRYPGITAVEPKSVTASP